MNYFFSFLFFFQFVEDVSDKFRPDVEKVSRDQFLSQVLNPNATKLLKKI